MSLVAKEICKSIKNNVILQNINLTLEPGTIYGFVGKNGSGKTMLFRALSGLMKIDSGTVIYNDKTLGIDMNILPSLGLVIENAGLYPELTGFRNLQLLAKLNNKINDEQISTVIRKVGLDPSDKRTFRKYSLGMKQRIVLAQAFMESPEILMLDEPTNALDEDGITAIRSLIREAADRGAIVLLSSHSKEDIQLLADKVYHIQSGQITKEDVNED